MKSTNQSMKRVPATQARGMSLIELMIAMALGVVLLLGLAEVFSAVRTSFSAAEANSRIQENSRFSLEFLRRDLRMAGHMTCLNEFFHFNSTVTRPTEPRFVNYLIPPGANREAAPYLLRVDMPVEVYDFNNTGVGDAYVMPAPTPPNDPTQWTPTLPAALGITADAVPGSDVVVVRYFDENIVAVSGGMQNGATGDIGVSAAESALFVDDALYGVSDCKGAALVQVTNKTATTIQINSAPNIERQPGQWWNETLVRVGVGGFLSRYRVVVYYIGQGVNGPTLKRKTFPEAPAAVASAANIVLGDAEEVVEGVDMMQIVLGLDTSVPRDDVTNLYRSPGAHLGATAAGTAREDALREINTLKISLLIRGTENNRGSTQTIATPVVGDVTVTPPADNRSRQVFDTLIAVRNRVRI